MKKVTEKIRAAKTSLDKLSLAMDAAPGGKFDDEIMEIKFWLKALNEPPANIQLKKRKSSRRRVGCKSAGIEIDWKADAKERIFVFGLWLAGAIERNDSALFRDMAHTIDAWSNHTPRPDNRRAAFIQIVRLHKAHEIRRAAFIEIVRLHKAHEMQAGDSLPLSMRKVIEYMVDRRVISVWPNEDAYKNLANTIRRWAREDKIQISGPRGNPTNRTRPLKKT